MRKRGRVSAAAIGVTPVRISAKARPAPPAGLTAREPGSGMRSPVRCGPIGSKPRTYPCSPSTFAPPSYARGLRASFAKSGFATRASPGYRGRGTTKDAKDERPAKCPSEQSAKTGRRRGLPSGSLELS